MYVYISICMHAAEKNRCPFEIYPQHIWFSVLMYAALPLYTELLLEGFYLNLFTTIARASFSDINKLT